MIVHEKTYRKCRPVYYNVVLLLQMNSNISACVAFFFMVVLNIIVNYGFKICSADSETIRLFKDQHFENFREILFISRRFFCQIAKFKFPEICLFHFREIRFPRKCVSFCLATFLLLL